MQVRELGEQRLLKRLQRFCPIDLIGDDAALLTVAEGYSLVVTTDMLVDGVHFSDRTTSPSDAGWRSAAANLSDLAAMGASPLGITIGLGLPGEVDVEWVEQFYQGVTACLQPYQTPIVGGDICRSPVLTVSITALGQVLPDRAIRRSVARPDDVIVVTGNHGASRAGLELLLHPQKQLMIDQTKIDQTKLIRSHQRPQPRLDVIPVLAAIWMQVEQETGEAGTATSCFRVAGMDSSDGLADAVLQICRASRVGAVLERNLIPFPPGLTAWISEVEAIDWALYGGEDFELVLCLPESAARKLVEQLAGAAIVGKITSELDVVLKDRTGLYPDQVLSLEKGFQHFGT
jgi:thiamine-monophosphate kinase